MSDVISFDELRHRMKQLPAVIQQKVVVGATRAAAKSIADDAKTRVPVRTGLLRKSIGVVKAKKRNTPEGHTIFYVLPRKKVRWSKTVSVGGRRGKMKVTQWAFYAHFVEFGTKKMKPIPYMGPAYKASARSSVEAFKRYASRRLEREVEKIR